MEMRHQRPGKVAVAAAPGAWRPSALAPRQNPVGPELVSFPSLQIRAAAVPAPVAAAVQRIQLRNERMLYLCLQENNDNSLFKTKDTD